MDPGTVGRIIGAIFLPCIVAFVALVTFDVYTVFNQYYYNQVHMMLTTYPAHTGVIENLTFESLSPYEGRGFLWTWDFGGKQYNSTFDNKPVSAVFFLKNDYKAWLATYGSANVSLSCDPDCTNPAQYYLRSPYISALSNQMTKIIITALFFFFVLFCALVVAIPILFFCDRVRNKKQHQHAKMRHVQAV